ncbi:arylamine N-acetyltransferase family protein [Streptomyces hainanensis]|uniref:Arylamine N-acetyltransferase n=1 Tax=Streptomyces hainanensis TaxID=402648 RepID=A0A4R4T4H3_9ACTN|nr:arylamine N-acetyltransferase [Streptomyces hainanensis]TDC71878.1 arylamine N-acetyltransferase [Streptomyces hainanensis]
MNALRAPDVTARDAGPKAGLELGAYLDRIGWTGPRAATAETLRALHRAHLAALPFENLDAVVLGTAPSLALADVQEKLVSRRRGGYCYEHNTLFAAVLAAFGFRVTGLAARVRMGGGGTARPRTHMTLLVDVAGEAEPFLADVGFGAAAGLLEAIPLVAGREVAAGPRRNRLVREPHPGAPADLWVLQGLVGGEWRDQYAFTLEPFEAADYAVMNWHIATHPRSPFRRSLYLQRTTADGGHREIAGRTLTVTAPDGTTLERRELVEDAELLVLLRADFGIEPPEGTGLTGRG